MSRIFLFFFGWTVFGRFGFKRLALKSFNRSVKSELTNIAASYFIRMRDQLPGGVKTRPGRLLLPEL
jgi:hypothetical protein